MITFTTETGSVYEVDEERRRIRRLSGTHEPTVNQGEDGEWQSYLKTSPIKKGQGVLIVWRIDGNNVRRTFTSEVTEVSSAVAA